MGVDDFGWRSETRSVEMQPLVSAAKRRQNAAHGASRGYRAGTGTSPEGAKEQFSRTL
jgi:hypothetical protein